MIHSIRIQIPKSAALALCVLTLTGCSAIGQRTLGRGTVPTRGMISREELRDQLNGFADYFKSHMDSTADELERQIDIKTVQMASLQMRIRTWQGLNAMLQQEDPIVAFLDVWTFCIRLRICLEEGNGSRMYGDRQRTMVDTVGDIESRIEAIGRMFLPEDLYPTTRREIYEFARNNPIRSNYSDLVMSVSSVRKNGANPFMAIIGIPMSPFRAMEGVDRTASAVSRFTDTAARFSDIVAELPESSRWQLLMLLYEMEETELAQSLSASFARISESGERLAKTSEQLPERLREQIGILLEEIDQKQTNVQTTLAQTGKTAESIQAILDKTEKVSSSIESLVVRIQETADAWKRAAQATGETVAEAAQFRRPEGSPPSTFNIQDYQATAAAVTEAARELQAATVELRQLIQPDTISAITGILVRRLIELIAAILAALLIHRIVIRAIHKPSK